MNYIKKMCILRQVKQGFSADGKSLSGLIKIEQYGKNVAIEISAINFAPLVSGEYYCLIADAKHRTETLPLRGKSIFNILSDLDISKGFCAVICFVKQDVFPIAYGINGDGEYDFKKIVNATLPPSFFKNDEKNAKTEIAKTQENPPNNDSEKPSESAREKVENFYNDEFLATSDYYENEREDKQLSQNRKDEKIENSMEKQTKATKDGVEKNENVENLRHPFTTESDGYYLSVKREIDEVFSSHEKDETLQSAFACSEWVRLKGEKENPAFLLGVIYQDGKALYICYALASEDRENPPKEIESVCAFVPSSPFDENKGFFVIFQSAATGECIKPQSI